MLYNAHAHGWLSFLDPKSFAPITEVVASLDIPIRLFVIAIEAGCLFLAFKRKLAISLLILLSVFHVGVFLLFGYLFWTWIALNIAFVALLLALRTSISASFFKREYLILSVVLILSSKYWCYPSSLGWIDSRLSYSYRYEAHTASGNRYALPFDYFEPYGDVFTMANFPYLVKSHNFLANPYGSSDRKSARELRFAKNLQDVDHLEKSIGIAKYDEQRSARFRDFVEKFAQNKQVDKTNIFQSIRPPRQFWTQPRGDELDNRQEIAEIVVTEVTTLFNGQAPKEIRAIELMRINVNQNQVTKQ